MTQDLTTYGTDLPDRPTLEKLLERLVQINGLEWIRLHYAFPTTVTDGLIRQIASELKNSEFFTGIRQNGVVMGLEFNHPEGAKPVMRHLYANGVWAIFSTLDPRVLQFKPGILMTQDLSEDLLRRVETAIGLAREDVMGGKQARAV